jgi:hypothetical protein
MQGLKQKGPITILCLLLILGMTTANLEENTSNLHKNVNKLMMTQQESGANIKKIYNNFMEMQPKLEHERKWDLKQLNWLPDELTAVATIIHQAIVMETNSCANMKHIIQENAIDNVKIIQEGLRLLNRRNRRGTVPGSKLSPRKHHTKPTKQSKGRLKRSTDNTQTHHI